MRSNPRAGRVFLIFHYDHACNRASLKRNNFKGRPHRSLNRMSLSTTFTLHLNRALTGAVFLRLAQHCVARTQLPIRIIEWARFRNQRARVVKVELAPDLGRHGRVWGSGPPTLLRLTPSGPDFIQPNPPK